MNFDPVKQFGHNQGSLKFVHNIACVGPNNPSTKIITFLCASQCHTEPSQGLIVTTLFFLSQPHVEDPALQLVELPPDHTFVFFSC